MIDWVAEACSNHNGDLRRALKIVDAAADMGCKSVKFQQFKIDKLFHESALIRSAHLAERRKWELPVEWNKDLSIRSRERGMRYISTPFYLEAVEELYPYVDAYKVSSYQLLWGKMLQEVGSSGKPVILSTGMASSHEITTAVTKLRLSGCRDLTLLHCVSAYPTPAHACNLKSIEWMRKAFECKVGWSDHSHSALVLNRAIYRWSAGMVEFHIDLDGTGWEFSTGHCWLPEDIAPIINGKPKFDDMGYYACDGKNLKGTSLYESDEREWRTDPIDGLRPMMIERRRLSACSR